MFGDAGAGGRHRNLEEELRKKRERLNGKYGSNWYELKDGSELNFFSGA